MPPRSRHPRARWGSQDLQPLSGMVYHQVYLWLFVYTFGPLVIHRMEQQHVFFRWIICKHIFQWFFFPYVKLAEGNWIGSIIFGRQWLSYLPKATWQDSEEKNNFGVWQSLYILFKITVVWAYSHFHHSNCVFWCVRRSGHVWMRRWQKWGNVNSGLINHGWH